MKSEERKNHTHFTLYAINKRRHASFSSALHLLIVFMNLFQLRPIECNRTTHTHTHNRLRATSERSILIRTHSFPFVSLHSVVFLFFDLVFFFFSSSSHCSSFPILCSVITFRFVYSLSRNQFSTFYFIFFVKLYISFSFAFN